MTLCKKNKIIKTRFNKEEKFKQKYQAIAKLIGMMRIVTS